ncbi:MAG: hypothetical protein HC888_04635 [Candidatus Competibacteraceae bacterium]|nr:hypothetical protein [Candidatus Competibacteraceae bacterium]
MFNIDAGGIGAAIISHLRAKGPKYAKVVKAINFGAKSQHKHATPRLPGPVNRRAEMWNRSKEWLDLEEGVSIPDTDVLQSDAISPRIKPKPNNDFLLESKEDMRKRGARSPDLWDAVALTFADIKHIKYDEKPKRRPEDPPPPLPAANPHSSVARANYVRTLRNGWMV